MKLFLSYKAFFSYPFIELWIVANAVKRKKMEWGGGVYSKISVACLHLHNKEKSSL